MAKDYRTCKAVEQFNTGLSKCPLNPGKIKGFMLVEKGYKLPDEITAESLMESFHADRPGRIYPVKIVEEYAPSGGELQTSATGYGATKVTGYSARTDVVTVEYDAGLKANIVRTKGVGFELYWVDENNVIFGEKGVDGKIKGIEMSGIGVGGQDFDSSGTQAELTISLMYTDIERYWKNMAFMEVDFNIIDVMNGLVFVTLLKEESGSNTYRLIETTGRLDITPYYGEKLAGSTAEEVWVGVTSVSYADGVLTVTPKSEGGTIGLKKPSILQTKGITGIEYVAS